MQVILPFSGTVQDYVAASVAAIKGLCKLATRARTTCCGGLSFWGSYGRGVSDGEGSREIRIVRMRCQRCGSTISFLPPFLLPRRRWSLDTVVDPLSSIVQEGANLQQSWLYGAWGDGPGMSARTHFELLRVSRELAEASEAGLQAWMASVAPRFDQQAVPAREDVLRHTEAGHGSSWRQLGLQVVVLLGLNKWLAVAGRAAVSVMGVIRFCATRPWTELLLEPGG